VAPVVASSAVEGVHENEVAPVAVSVAVAPMKTVAELTVTVGYEIAVICTELCVWHPMLFDAVTV